MDIGGRAHSELSRAFSRRKRETIIGGLAQGELNPATSLQSSKTLLKRGESFSGCQDDVDRIAELAMRQPASP